MPHGGPVAGDRPPQSPREAHCPPWPVHAQGSRFPGRGPLPCETGWPLQEPRAERPRPVVAPGRVGKGAGCRLPRAGLACPQFSCSPAGYDPVSQTGTLGSRRPRAAGHPAFRHWVRTSGVHPSPEPALPAREEPACEQGRLTRTGQAAPAPRRTRPVSALDQCACPRHPAGRFGAALGELPPMHLPCPQQDAASSLGRGVVPTRQGRDTHDCGLRRPSVLGGVPPRLRAARPCPRLFEAVLGPGHTWWAGAGSQHQPPGQWDVPMSTDDHGNELWTEGAGHRARTLGAAPATSAGGPLCASTQGPTGPNDLQFTSSTRSRQPAPRPSHAIPVDAREQPLVWAARRCSPGCFLGGREGGSRAQAPQTAWMHIPKGKGRVDGASLARMSWVTGSTPGCTSDFGNRRATESSCPIGGPA